MGAENGETGQELRARVEAMPTEELMGEVGRIARELERSTKHVSDTEDEIRRREVAGVLGVPASAAPANPVCEAIGYAMRGLVESAQQRMATELPEDLPRIVQRMRQSEAEDKSERHYLGIVSGRKWAADHARPQQLRRLAVVVAGDGCYGDPCAYAEIANNSSNAGAWSVLAADLNGHDDADPDEFWENAGADFTQADLADTDFAAGFVRGSLGIWGLVKDHV